MLEAIALVIGEQLNHTLSVCLKKEDATEIVKTDKEKGRAEAERVWQAKEECATLPIIGHLVGKVVYEARIGEQTTRVVEIRHGRTGEVIAFFITRDDVNPAKDVRHISNHALAHILAA